MPACVVNCEHPCSWQTWMQVSVGRKTFFTGALGRCSYRTGNGCIWKCLQPPTGVLLEVDLSWEVHRSVWNWYPGTCYPQRSTYQLLRLLLKGILCILFFQKLHVFLFQEVLVITRAVTHNEQLCYQLYQQPIPMNDLLLEDLQDGEVRLGGSLRGAFSNNERIKNFFRVSFKNGSQSQTHSLQANDTFNKQQWLNCIRQAKETVLCATGQATVLDSEGPFLDPATGSREPQGETKLEQMDQSDSESDCSMDMSEVSLDCEHMEQTESSCGNSRHVESNVWQKRVLPGSRPVSYLYSVCIPHAERFGEALFHAFVTVLTESLLSVLFCL